MKFLLAVLFLFVWSISKEGGGTRAIPSLWGRCNEHLVLLILNTSHRVAPFVLPPTQRSSPSLLLQGLQALRCPHGLAFNLDQQTCDWKDNVKNCDRKEKTKVVKPLFNTVEPLCQVVQRALVIITIFIYLCDYNW